MQLYMIKNVTKHLGDDNTPVVIVFELVGGDRWGCKPGTMVRCAGGIAVRARDLAPGERIWLNIEQMLMDGTFHRGTDDLQESN